MFCHLSQRTKDNLSGERFLLWLPQLRWASGEPKHLGQSRAARSPRVKCWFELPWPLAGSSPGLDNISGRRGLNVPSPPLPTATVRLAPVPVPAGYLPRGTGQCEYRKC